jgi:hypothetical protein
LQLQQLENEQARMSISSAPSQEGEIAPPAALSQVDFRRFSNSMPPPLHLLKFNYDATSPQVNITLSLYPTPLPTVEGKEAIEDAPKMTYSGVHPGGFNQPFILPPHAALDLSNAIAPLPAPLPEGEGVTGSDGKEITPGMANLSVDAANPVVATVQDANDNEEQSEHRGSRIMGMFRRGAPQADPEAQIEMTNQTDAEKKKEEEEKEVEKGLRLLIKIDAIGPDGT